LSASTSDHEGAHIVADLELVDDGDDRIVHRATYDVAAFGVVHREHGDAIGDIDLDEGHSVDPHV
jgi:hypothetical protein